MSIGDRCGFSYQRLLVLGRRDWGPGQKGCRHRRKASCRWRWRGMATASPSVGDVPGFAHTNREEEGREGGSRFPLRFEWRHRAAKRSFEPRGRAAVILPSWGRRQARAGRGVPQPVAQGGRRKQPCRVSAHSPAFSERSWLCPRCCSDPAGEPLCFAAPGVRPSAWCFDISSSASVRFAPPCPPYAGFRQSVSWVGAGSFGNYLAGCLA